MKRSQLYVEHRYKGRFVGARKYESGQRPIFLGSGRQTHIRLLGEEVGGVHAVIENKDAEWVVSDLGSISGTWVGESSVVEHKISKETQVRIGDHELRLVPQNPRKELFSEAANGSALQQIVVRYNGTIVSTRVLSRSEPFDMAVGGEQIHLNPLKGNEPVRKTVGAVEIIQHLVNSPEPLPQQKIEVTKDAKMTLSLVGSVMIVIIALTLWRGKSVEEEKKPEENQYTKMIYDAKVVQEKRSRAMALSKTAFGNMQQNNKPSEVTPKDLGVSTKVISKIKASGLTQLIGKIAKRAGKASDWTVSAVGKDSPVSSNNVTTVGGGATGAAVKNAGQGYKIAGVGTSGKAGGGAYKEGTGMAAGTTGNAEVGVVEEESIVDGGLDREVIAAIIKENLGQIRYCYERQLSASPDIYGKVAVRFVIGASGEVTSQQIGATTLNNAMVEGCILRRVARWKFPNPKGGTSVIVTYPFLFKSLN